MTIIFPCRTCTNSDNTHKLLKATLEASNLGYVKLNYFDKVTQELFISQLTGCSVIWENKIQQNFTEATWRRLDRCQVIRYSGFSSTINIDLLYTGKFLLQLLCLGYRTNHRSRPFGYILQLLVYSHQDPFLCVLVLCSLHSWGSWQCRRQGVGRYHNSWCTETLEGHLEHVPETWLLQWWNFFGKKQIFPSWDYSLQMVDYQDFFIIRHQINGILLYNETTTHLPHTLLSHKYHSVTVVSVNLTPLKLPPPPHLLFSCVYH